MLTQMLAHSKSIVGKLKHLGTHEEKPFLTKIGLEVSIGRSFGGDKHHHHRPAKWIYLI